MYQTPFGNFYDRVMQQPVQTNTVEVDMTRFSKNGFKNIAQNVLNMNEHDIAVTVKNYIDEISADILSGDIPYINIFSDMNFINGFVKALNSIPINYDIRLACNKLTYDYFTSDNARLDIKQKYLGVSKAVNKLEISRIMALGIDENTASNLVLCRYSSKNESTNVKRLNFTLYHKDPNVMTEQMIVWIYEKLFDRISDLFYATMFEVYTPEQEEEFGDNFMEIYGVVGLAVIDILNNMTSDALRPIIRRYCETWEYYNRPRVRFSLRSLSSDYSHIARVVDGLIADGCNVP